MEFSQLGKHCTFPSCHKLDFLPFTCDYCQNVYCLDHRTIQNHNCIQNNDTVKVTPQCPVCQQMIYVPANQSIDNVINAHINSKCTTHLFNNVEQHVKQVKAERLRCDYVDNGLKCRNKNNYETLRCKHCHHQFCLTHRDVYSHKCEAANKLNKSHSHNGVTGTLSSMAGAAVGGAMSKGQQLLDKIRQNREDRDSNAALGIKSKSTNSNKSLSLQQLRSRMTAQGDNRVVEKQRFYLDITLPTTTIDGRPSRQERHGIMSFFNKNKTVGSVIEELSQRYDIENRNAEQGVKKLLLYSVRNKAALPFDVPLELLPPQVDQNDQLQLMYQ